MRLCLSEGVAGDGGEFLCLLVLVTENGLCAPLCCVFETSGVGFDGGSKSNLLATTLLSAHAIFVSLLVGFLLQTLLLLLEGEHNF